MLFPRKLQMLNIKIKIKENHILKLHNYLISLMIQNLLLMNLLKWCKIQNKKEIKNYINS